VVSQEILPTGGKEGITLGASRVYVFHSSAFPESGWSAVTLCLRIHEA
jgi:hypothetical protein